LDIHCDLLQFERRLQCRAGNPKNLESAAEYFLNEPNSA
jgi:hypothetical protein